MKNSVSFIFFYFSICLGGWASLGAVKGVVKDYDIRYYHPENLALKDLVYEVRFPNLLKETIKKNTAIENIKDVYYKVYWAFPWKQRIDMIGLPKGFHELEMELKMLLVGKLDYVIPPKLESMLKGYKLTQESQRNGERQITLEDPSGKRKIRKFSMVFGRSGKLEKITTFGISGIQESLLQSSTKSWSNNKWVLNKIIRKSKDRVKKNTVVSKLYWTVIDGFGFPSKIKTKTTIESLAVKKNGEKVLKRKLIVKLFSPTMKLIQVRHEKPFHRNKGMIGGAKCLMT